MFGINLLQAEVALVIIFVALIGLMVWVGMRETRAEEIREALPESLDILTVMLEAGMSLDGAMNEVAQRSNNVLGKEFAQVMREIQAGADRNQALDAMAKRCDNPDLAVLVEAIKQSESMGTSLADVMRFQATELRRVRRERAQRKAASARIKMLLPMVGCIFPTIFITILGPAVYLLMNTFNHFGK